MKKIFIVLIALVLLLTACGTATTTIDQTVANQEATTTSEQATTASCSSSSQTPATLSTDYANAVPAPMQLMIGILQLENTDLAVTSVQSTSLLPLLTSARELVTSNTVTQEQINSLTQQVQSILSSEQIQAIANSRSRKRRQ